MGTGDGRVPARLGATGLGSAGSSRGAWR